MLQHLKSVREVEILIYGEGRPVVQIVNELVPPGSDVAHGVVHGDFVKVVAAEDSLSNSMIGLKSSKF